MWQTSYSASFAKVPQSSATTGPAKEEKKNTQILSKDRNFVIPSGRHYASANFHQFSSSNSAAIPQKLQRPEKLENFQNPLKGQNSQPVENSNQPNSQPRPAGPVEYFPYRQKNLWEETGKPLENERQQKTVEKQNLRENQQFLEEQKARSILSRISHNGGDEKKIYSITYGGQQKKEKTEGPGQPENNRENREKQEIPHWPQEDQRRKQENRRENRTFQQNQQWNRQPSEGPAVFSSSLKRPTSSYTYANHNEQSARRLEHSNSSADFSSSSYGNFINPRPQPGSHFPSHSTFFPSDFPQAAGPTKSPAFQNSSQPSKTVSFHHSTIGGAEPPRFADAWADRRSAAPSNSQSFSRFSQAPVNFSSSSFADKFHSLSSLPVESSGPPAPRQRFVDPAAFDRVDLSEFGQEFSYEINDLPLHSEEFSGPPARLWENSAVENPPTKQNSMKSQNPSIIENNTTGEVGNRIPFKIAENHQNPRPRVSQANARLFQSGHFYPLQAPEIAAAYHNRR